MPFFLLFVACPPSPAIHYADGLGPGKVERACAPQPHSPPRRACPECDFRFHSAPPPASEPLHACLGAPLPPGDPVTLASSGVSAPGAE